MMRYEELQTIVADLQKKMKKSPSLFIFCTYLYCWVGFSIYLAASIGSTLIALGSLIAMIVVPQMGHRVGNADEPRWFYFLPSFAVSSLTAWWLWWMSLEHSDEDERGLPIDPSTCPSLYEEILDVCDNLDAAVPDRILLVHGMNARALNRPLRFGLRGFRREIHIGLPIMLLLNRQELLAVIGHEIGHFSGRQAKLGQTFTLIARICVHFMNELEGRWWSVPINMVIGEYLSRLRARYIVISRSFEFFADREGGRAVSPQVKARALLKILASELYMDRFSAEMSALNRIQPEPPDDLYHRLRESMRRPLEADRLRVAIEVESRKKDDVVDEHPTLRDRIAALGHRLDAEQAMQVLSVSDAGACAAEECLGDQYQAIMTMFSAEWKIGIEQGWRGKRDLLLEARKETSERAANKKSTPDEIEWVETLEGLLFDPPETVLPKVLDFSHRYPHSNVARFHTGRLLLALGRFEGIDYLQSMSFLASPQLINDAVGLGMNFLVEHGQARRADEFQVRMRQLFYASCRIVYERENIDKESRFIAPDLPAGFRERLCQVAAGFEQISRIYAVRKVCHASPDPVYVIVVSRRVGMLQLAIEKPAVQLLQDFKEKLGEIDWSIIFVADVPKTNWCVRRIQCTPGGLIYRTERKWPWSR